jgi:hypothetical protein
MNMEQQIVESAVRAALVFGTGIYSAVKEALTDEGYKMTQEIEKELPAIVERIERSMK